MKNEIDEIINEQDIRNKIYILDGKEVMLDSDLAELYYVETKRINEAVKNNPQKFPNRYSWVLNDKNVINLRSKFSTLEIKGQGKYSKYAPRVFTEQGIYMLATILKSKQAVNVSIKIMDTFVKMRHYLNYNKSFLPNRILLLEDKVDENTKKINELFDMFNPNDIIKNYIFYEGEFYDSYSFLLDIFNRAKNDIILIDNYAGKELLDILKNLNTKITVVSKNIDNKLKEKYLKQYSNISFVYNSSFHDKFIIIDKKILYSCGASFKDVGKKCFSIHYIDSVDQTTKILKELELIQE